MVTYRALARSIRLVVPVAMCVMTLPAGAEEASLQNVPPREFDAGQASADRRVGLLEIMLSDPTDLEAAFEYATLSSRAGEVESAISTLERLRIFAPDAARLQYELGVLYFRLGSYSVAEQYFSEALDASGLPDHLRTDALRYIAEIRRETAPVAFSGSVAMGTRFQTNANGGASNPISAFLGNYLLPRAARASADVDAFLSGQLHYSRDLQSQGDRLDANFAFYGSAHANQSRLNTGLAELTLGPVFDLGRFGFADASIGIHGVLGGVVLGGNWYRATVGASVSLRQEFTATTRAEMRVGYRRQFHANSPTRLASTDRDGHLFGAQARLTHDFTDRLAAHGTVNAMRFDARKRYQSFDEVGGEVGITYRFDSPFAGQKSLWILDVSAGVAKRHFDVRDPVFTPTTPAEKVVEAFLRSSVAVPVNENWTLETSIGYSILHSNYDFHSYDNLDASLSVRRVF